MKPNTFNRFISIFFHPIFYPLIASLVFIFYIPRFIQERMLGILLGIVFFGTILFPTVMLFVLKKTKLIETYYLNNIVERKFPLIIFTLLALMLSRVFFKMEVSYDLAIFFIAGSMSFLIGYWFLWFHIKMSIHTLGLGGLIGFIIQLSMNYHLNFLFLIAILFVLFGLVAKARYDLGAHNFKEIFWGFIIGIFPQLLIPLWYQNI